MKLLKLRFFYFVCLLSTLCAWAQDTNVSGKVTDENGLPVPGASVLVKGTSNSASSDIDGNYQIMASPSATLVISYVGYANQEIAINGQTSINVSLAPEAKTLEEVVVVGYGTQKKSVVTGAISSVKSKDLENLPLTTVGQSLQGRASGVFVAQNAGQPGSAATIRVRGITSFNNNNPLWVVDGVIVDNGGINYLNQSDIESMEVLKDAASQAIYGARAAAGVILVTTKKGKAGKFSVTYNGFAGFSQAARKLDLLNGTQYATLRNEQYANGFTGGTFQLPYPNAANIGKGTDWQDVIFNKSAQRTQHEFSVSGGSEKSTFYMSVGLTDQEGIVMTDISNYLRKNIRINSTHKLSKYFTIGQNVGYSHEKTVGIGNTNGEFGGPLASAIALDPVTPLTVSPADVANQPNSSEYGQYAVKDPNGNFYGISSAVANEMSNPLAYAAIRDGNYGWADNFVGNAYIEAMPIEGLKIRSTVGGKLAYWGSESFTPISYLNGILNNTKNSLYRETNKGFGWNIENTISYNKLIGSHNFTVLLGQAAYEDDITSGEGVTYFNQPVNTHAEASFNWATPADDINAWASTGNRHVVSSLFARANYDYKEKYLFTGIIRRDGSSRFGSNNKYGTFPSFSLGWVPTKEDFWKENTVVNTLKFRGGYGVVGSDAIPNFAYLALVSGGRNYTLGNQGNVVVGYSPNAPSNPDLKWEETAQTNVGFEATLFRDLSLEFDWYKKKTTGILQGIQLPGYVGATGQPQGNVADMENTGVELSLTYRKQIGEFNISVSGNASTLKNKVTYVGQDREFNTGPGFQSMGALTRYEVGSAFNEFYGFQTNGIFQNQAEIDSYTNSAGIVIQPDAVPGDFKWKDLNDDGQITDDDDRKYLGNPLPNFTYGLTINLEYQGFDLMAFGQGVSGNKVFQGLRRLDLGNANWQTNALERWTGEGTSNTYPRLSTSDNNKNFTRMSNFYLQDGDYFRIKIIQLGYSLPADLIKQVGLSKTRIYVTTENLFTFTKYTGYDPEIGGDVGGIDRGYYPQAKSFMLGCNLAF
ncbi:SusC/RagA family TonB-linked outer membrane protein [Flavobacterium subsaxonicum]|uniref:TonB-dependent receptor n=1 Tax=Flavobacterium subsaxonicum WB 4.1-42 = DSM 21790 TaxID=1121898 RepID=A0A0A2MN52_9FLAO|nr:TonB-dependent receptor [Flavobacterium subsaxonicum]KGO93734.1 TonB-dependent receptor [Flavobacterium subsaxonicum WB 4.1-42 = DSM 21790]